MMAISAERESRTVATDGISAEEWQLRCDLAACYQLSALYGMFDPPGNHISARVPGPEHHFLLNPFNMFFDEITASSLIKVDFEGNIVAGTGGLNPAGFTIHSAVHMARPDLVCVMHTHTRAVNGVAMQKDGLLPVSQKALTIWDYLAYHDYEGVATNLDERQRIARDLGDKARCMILRNHGALTVGRTIAEAFSWMMKLEGACQHQIDGLAGNRELITLSDETIKRTAANARKAYEPGGMAPAGWEWPQFIRKLERERGTSYRT
jgi:ribulose-5-phosphate 4-epimerase/fuculose-1-phosphate aldolase